LPAPGEARYVPPAAHPGAAAGFRMTRLLIFSLVAILVLVVVPVALAVSFPARVLNALTSRSGYTVERDVAYGALPSQTLDIYRPETVTAETPVLVFFHGGGWNRGSKNDYLFVGQSLATAGMILVVPDYRLYPEVVFPDFVADAAEAVAFARDRLAPPDGAPRLFLFGHSAGAQIAALLNLDEHYLRDAGLAEGAVDGMIGLSGPYDFLPLKEDIYKAIFPEAVRPASQPIAFVDGSEAPMLLLTGDADRTVNPGNTTRLAAAILAKGGRAVSKVYPGVRHLDTVSALASAIPWSKPAVRQTIIDFVAAQPRRGGR
jgi:acetyl esterase/lipase